MAYDPFPNLGYTPYGPIAPGVARGLRPRVLTATFGDGYAQRTGDGINQRPSIFNYRTKLLTRNEVNQLDNFLSSKKGYIPFTYQPPNTNSPIQYTCSSWDILSDHPLYYTLVATFDENFDP